MLNALARRPWKRSLAWLCFLGPFFFLTYGFANQHTASLAQVGSFVFAWEQHIPFWPWTIIPYWSIDVFYGLSLFLFIDKRELDRHAARLILATVICVAGFLLFPLRFSFEKPEIAQPLFGWLFEVLGAFDLPFNQSPSLHVCLLIVLWAAFKRHTPARWKLVVHIWAVVIGISVFTTYQHHIIDGIWGIIAGLLCTYFIPLVPQRSWKASQPYKARGLAMRYGAGGLFLLAVVLGIDASWPVFLLWPALCLLVLSWGYLYAGPSIFRKTEGMGQDAGTRCVDSRIILAPYELGARIVRALWFKAPPAVEIVPGLWLGGYPASLPVADCGVLDLTAEYPRAPVTRGRPYASVPMMDLLSPPLDSQSPDSETVERALAAYAELKQHGPVLVHCALGMTRSAAIVCRILLSEGTFSCRLAAVSHVVSQRPGVVLSDAQEDPFLKTSEEALWNILITLLADEFYEPYSPEYMARRLSEAGYTDIEHIRNVFFNEVFPVCFLPYLFDFAGLPFDEKLTGIAIRKHKKSILSKIITKCILLFCSKKNFLKIFSDVGDALNKLQYSDKNKDASKKCR